MTRFIRRPFLLHIVATAGFCATAAALQAKPDFTASEIAGPGAKVTEGDVARFQLRLRNRGDAAAEPAHLRILWPRMGYVVAVNGADVAKVDPDAAEVAASVKLPAGGERSIEVVVLAPRDAGGRSLSLSAQIIHYPTMAETWIHQTVTIDTRIKTDGVRIGWLRIASAGIVTLAWLAITVLAMVVVSVAGRGRGQNTFFGPRAGVAGVMIAIGFWLIFAAMAWRDWCVLHEWTETTGTIVGRRVETQSVSTSRRRASGSGAETSQSQVSKPEFAVRYGVDGREMYSTGYDTGSSLRVGGGVAQLEKEFQEWKIGARVPCWYDPRDPADIVLKRGFGGAYIFALLPLMPFWMGWKILRRRFSNAGD
ncbi:MAG: DUF3592 domain-containing protein [Verrucomicrobiaceae bacterium]|nr:DUF3592 domain-containing protein [Verrucomicrobiaceae bacterium]